MVRPRISLRGWYESVAKEVMGKRLSVGEGSKVRLGSRRQAWRICTPGAGKERKA